MRHLPSQFTIITTLTFVMLVAAGCRTPAQTGSRRRSFNRDKEASTPFLQRGDYPERLGLVMQEVLADHRFSLPWIVVRGSDSSTWFMAERFESEHRFDRVSVHATPQEGVTASITAYQLGPTDWAILGSLVADFSPEARSIAAEIAKTLGNDRPGVR